MSFFRACAAAFLFIGTATGCSTTFMGSSTVNGGRTGCESKCAAQDMECVGMVFFGEYSDGCVCRIPGKRLSLQDAASASGAPVVGVTEQTRQAERQSQSGHVP